MQSIILLKISGTSIILKVANCNDKKFTHDNKNRRVMHRLVLQTYIELWLKNTAIPFLKRTLFLVAWMAILIGAFFVIGHTLFESFVLALAVVVSATMAVFFLRNR